jgi:hypothetical protein
MEYSIQDIIDATVEGEPVKVQAAFDHLIGQKIMDSLEAKKREIASTMFNGADEVESEEDTEDQDAEDQDTQSA